MQKTGITEILGYAQFGALWIMGFFTWWIASDVESVSGKIAVLQAMAMLTGISGLGVIGRKAWKEGKQVQPDEIIIDDNPTTEETREYT